jgi:hypothetical protein
VTGAAASDVQTPERYYKSIIGPEAIVMKSGDEYVPYQSQRPGSAWQGFMDFLAQTICLSANIPPSVLLQIKVGGADTRRDLAAAQRTFEVMQLDLSNELQRVYEYIIAGEIADGWLANAPKDWALCDWQFPKAITVDAGREANNDREDVKMGLLTRREYHGRFGEDWRDVDEQVLTEADALVKQAQTLANANDIDFIVALNLLQQRSPSSGQAIAQSYANADAMGAATEGAPTP